MVTANIHNSLLFDLIMWTRIAITIHYRFIGLGNNSGSGRRPIWKRIKSYEYFLVLVRLFFGFFYSKIVLDVPRVGGAHIYEKIFSLTVLIISIINKTLRIKPIKKLLSFMPDFVFIGVKRAGRRFIFMVDISTYLKKIMRSMPSLLKLLDLGWIEKNLFLFINKEFYNLYILIEKNYLNKFYGFLIFFIILLFI